MATAGMAKDAEEAEKAIGAPLREAVNIRVRLRWMNPWCGLCHARSDTWRYETARTQFHSMDEAMPALKQQEQDQRQVAAVFGDIPRSD
jgi:hypothetical protein